jgi:hypothetical protein
MNIGPVSLTFPLLYTQNIYEVKCLNTETLPSFLPVTVTWQDTCQSSRQNKNGIYNMRKMTKESVPSSK